MIKNVDKKIPVLSSGEGASCKESELLDFDMIMTAQNLLAQEPTIAKIQMSPFWELCSRLMRVQKRGSNLTTEI